MSPTLLVLWPLLACGGDPPTVTITLPEDGATFRFGETVTIEARAEDPRHPYGYLEVAFSSSLQGDLEPLGQRTATADGAFVLVVDGLEAGRHVIEVTATNPDGLSGSDTVAIEVLENAVPEVSFDAPAAGAAFFEGEAIEVLAWAVDPDRRDQTVLSLSWSGSAAVGSLPFSPSADGHVQFELTGLAVGEHALTLEALDPEGGLGAATVTFSVEVPDADGDGYLDAAVGGDDCDDADPTIHPGAEEACDGIDRDCDGETDDPESADAATWYPDADLDGYGEDAGATVACAAPAGTVAQGGDCDDADPTIHPGAAESCDGVDQDCDGTADDACTGDLGAAVLVWGAAGDEVGGALLLAGDVDGDGLPEVAAGRPGALGGAGGLTLVPGSQAAPAALADIGPAWDGPVAGQRWGTALAGGVDLTSDGLADLAVGAPGADAAITLLPGPLDGALDPADAPTVPEAAPGDALGTALAVLLPTDAANPAPTLAAGAPGQDDAAADAGAVYLYEGPFSPTTAPATADGLLRGEAAGDGAGAALAPAGDVDGDGAADLLVGGPAAEADAGRAWLVEGPVRTVRSLADARARIAGEVSGDAMGAALDGGGDLDGDGRADLVLGAPGADGGAGRVYVVGSRVRGDLLAGDAADRVVTGLAGDGLGAAVAGAGDLDGDGQADLLLGLPGNGDGAAGGGGLAVFWGPLPSGTLAATDADARLHGVLAGAAAGASLALLPDRDGDGRPEIVAGAPGEATGGPDAGALLLLESAAWAGP